MILINYRDSIIIIIIMAMIMMMSPNNHLQSDGYKYVKYTVDNQRN